MSDPGAELITKSLEEMRSKQVRLLNVRSVTEKVQDSETGETTDQITTYATVYVANSKKQHFVKKIEDYLALTLSTGKPKNERLVNSIADIRKALLVGSFWTDFEAVQPTTQPEWIEVWLSTDNDAVIDEFEYLLDERNLQSRDGVIKFPERAVKVILATAAQLEMLTTHSAYIAEYRRAKETAAFYVDMSNREQAEWVESMQERLRVDDDSASTVCILDTGVNNGHPLLAPILGDADCQSVDQAWGVDDHDKHGTLMAGVIGYGDITRSLSSDGPIHVKHRIESVKILPPPPDRNEPNLWGYITSQAISLAEIQAPDRNRSICMAVTAEDTRDRGKPSSWSAMIDQLASAYNDDTRRLIMLSAGNVTCSNADAANNYPDKQLEDSVHDPAQSWNALTVGAYTKAVELTDPTLAGYRPVAGYGELSPFTTTSQTWEENKWPVKPELVLEGGNLAVDSTGFCTEPDDFKILSTYYHPQDQYFYPFNMTSAAAAQLARMTGIIQAENSGFWPETVRALLVHSAEWPEPLKRQFVDQDSKTALKRLLSICGYGVPNLERALHSMQNSLTLISQATIRPFDKKPSDTCKTRDMHLYELPWPRDVLLGLPDSTQVNMKITLSYFIEPGPGEIGWKDRYRYASHGLRFDLNSPGESKDEFCRRVNKAARDEENGRGHPGTESASSHWMLGKNARNRGSIHSDTWIGTAAELAASNLVSVAPTTGWWKERAYLGRWNRETRYSLVVSITTPDETVDVYTPVAIQVGVPIAVEIAT